MSRASGDLFASPDPVGRALAGPNDNGGGGPSSNPLEKWLVDIRLEEKVASGAEGQVFRARYGRYGGFSLAMTSAFSFFFPLTHSLTHLLTPLLVHCSTTVAAKELFSVIINPADLADFSAEISTLARLQHPNIVRLFGLSYQRVAPTQLTANGLYVVRASRLAGPRLASLASLTTN